MKIRNATASRRRRAFEVETFSGGRYTFPFARAEPQPTVNDPVIEVYPDPELGREGFTYALQSGAEGSVHIDHVLEYNEDPGTVRALLVHKLSVAANERLKSSGLSVREICRRLSTSPAQLYRLIDTANERKSIDKLVELLVVLDCEVDVIVAPNAA